ncbi:2-phosphosulfolactate phosphatase [Streptomyces sp. ADMS]|nr:2-phosphosulfolactate phosphatase [Streptomyces sp. ADMS]MDW4906865.1 2-phosphosulfolactate phosphatase [Streptomyces sp. ADMS]
MCCRSRRRSRSRSRPVPASSPIRGTTARPRPSPSRRTPAGRRSVSPGPPWSLSPAALRRAPFAARLVLLSPNGSAISAAAGDTTRVVAACLRNATTVGAWLAERGYGTAERPVCVIAAGERRPDGSLRPALEDLLGAGAVVASLDIHGSGRTALSRGRHGLHRLHRLPGRRRRRLRERLGAGTDRRRLPRGRGDRDGG